MPAGRNRAKSPAGTFAPFVAIVFGNQATTYNNRERRHLWASRPSARIMASSGADILIATVLPVTGIAMAPLPGSLVIGTLLGAAAHVPAPEHKLERECVR